MDDPAVGPSAPMKLQRACERNRLENQFLITAYESLAPIIERDGPSANRGEKQWDERQYPATRSLADNRGSCLI
jgi:hypothetical protein